MPNNIAIKMRSVFILSFIANLVMTAVSLAALPERVAVHFGADGAADGWMSNTVNALFMTALHLLLFCSIRFSPRLMVLLPAKWVNLPDKEYWLAPAHRHQAVEQTERIMWRFGVAIFLFFLVVGGLVVDANLCEPVKLNMPVFYLALGLFLVFSVWWTVDFYRTFRVNKRI